VCTGTPLTADTPSPLVHNDRIRMGQSNFFRFIVPAVAAKKDAKTRDEDDSKYGYDFVKEESMKSLISGLMEDEKAAQRREAEMKAELAARAAEVEVQKREFEAKIRAEAEGHDREMKAMLLKMQAETKRGEEAKMLEAQKKMQEMEAEFKRQKAEMEKQQKIKEEQEADYAKTQAEDRERIEKAREIAKKQLQMNLVDAIPIVQECNTMAKDLGLSILYEVKIIMKRQTGSAATYPSTVIVMKNTATQQIQRWDMSEFQSNYPIMHDQHERNMERLKNGQSVDLPEDSPFKININSLQNVGQVG
jgi:hypothetical protein